MDRKPCFKCCRKHLSQAKIKWNEMRMGYPQHYELCFKDMENAEEALWLAFDKWQECMGEMAEASEEILLLNESFANKIRDERIRLERNPNHCPDFTAIIRESKVLEEKIGSKCGNGSCPVSVARRGNRKDDLSTSVGRK